MGLPLDSDRMKLMESSVMVGKKNSNERVIALAGNPNVGKSTIFNGLTGMRQHTGNWPGKTVTSASGICTYQNQNYLLVDLPGTYSLMAHSAEEEVSRDYICFSDADLTMVICDATCLQRNLNLVLQTLEITNKVLVCINLVNEAEKKHITINFKQLEEFLGVPVIGINAFHKKDLNALIKKASEIIDSGSYGSHIPTDHIDSIEYAIQQIEYFLEDILPSHINSRWIAMKLLDFDNSLIQSLDDYLGFDLAHNDDLLHVRNDVYQYLESHGISRDLSKDFLVIDLLKRAEHISSEVVRYQNKDYNERDRKIDRILTGKLTGFPIMILLLLLVFWITITGSNYPSKLMFHFLFVIEEKLMNFTTYIGIPRMVQGILINGAYRVLAWVVSVMLPPMAIFFPLFTILEDSGYLPRIAFNLDHYFKKACSCGKQSLTMCLGFGCNAVGVIGCRIIDSPRERLIAIITNSFVPCNGRFPTLISIISMFFVSNLFYDSKNNMQNGILASLVSALILTSVIIFGILMTFLVSRILSKTILKGIPSAFTLELPPYRKPQVGKIIIRSIFDRTFFVLGRAAAIAVPAGLLIWFFANVSIKNCSILSYCTNFLDPLGRLMGLDGVILMAFILGFPANEIVVPIIIMTYMASGSLINFDDLNELKYLLTQHGWTWLTAICMMLFSLMHWPCSTTCLTIKKETGSLKWTALSFMVPTIMGIIICTTVAAVGRLFFF